MTAASTADLLRAYRDGGDTQARDRLVEEHLPLVRALAARYAHRGVPLDDLVQVGSIGLIKAVDRFDPERGVELTTYAVPTIVGELKRHFRDAGWAVHVPRRLKDLSLRLGQAMEELSVTLGRSPTVSELAEALEIDEEEVVEALDASQAYSALSLSDQGAEDEEAGGPRLSSLPVEEPGYEAVEGKHLLAPALAELDDRDREIIRLRFAEGLTQSEIAGRIGISQMHVSRLIRRALETMRRELEPAGRGSTSR